MKVIILAAGMGTRFVDDESRRPKCLLTVQGHTLLGTNIDQVFSADPEAEVVVVTGFMAGEVEGYLNEFYPLGEKIRTVFNPEFNGTVVLSIRKGFGAVSSGETVLLLNGDTLFSRQVFHTAHGLSRVPADRIVIFGNRTDVFLPDDMKLAVSGSSVRRIGKDIPDANAVSSGAILLCGGGLRTYLETIHGAAVDALKTHHGILQFMLEQGSSIRFGDLGTAAWIEIDRRQDLNRDFSVVLDS